MSGAADNSARAEGLGVAWATAAVAGAFSLIVCALLGFNFARMRGADLRDSDQLNALKQELFRRPGDPQLQQRIRRLDLQLRLDYFRRRSFAATGAWLLLGGAAVCLIGAKLAAGLRKRPPAPQPQDPTTDRHARAAALARWSAAAAGLALACAAILLAATTRSSLDDLLKAEPPLPSPGEMSDNWPGFRGPGGAGISAYADVPTSWNGRTGEGILWKTPVPLPGQNSPVVWADRVFLTGATEKQREVYCFDAGTGKLLWRRPVSTPAGSREVPRVEEGAGFAAPTAAVDGRRVYAIFANGDLACFDFGGSQLWAKSLGLPDNDYGYASSLTTHRHLLIVQYDQNMDAEGRSRSQLIALDGATGRVAWVTDRDVPDSWATPIVAETPRGWQLITSADPWVIAYDPADGREIWRAKCMAGDVAPSPTYGAGLVFAVNSEAELVAIRPDGTGDVTTTHVAWTAQADLPDICSPLCDGKRLYLLTSDGLLTCYAAGDGKKLWQHELETTFHCSPSLAGDRIYLISQGGLTWIVAAADAYEEIAKAELGENCDTCPAFMDGRIYIRGEKHLFCIGRK